MNTKKFRSELIKLMPGYKWTLHRKSPFNSDFLTATGIQSSGFNRLSTLEVTRFVRNEEIRYEVKSSGFGKRAGWLSTYEDKTLARALRGLQNHYEYMAQEYDSHAGSLKMGRRR